MRRFASTVAVLLLTAAAHAQTVSHALDFTLGGGQVLPSGGGNAMFGWQFDVISPIKVLALDVWDFQGNGFVEGSHQVGIWDSSNNLLTSTIVSNTSIQHPGQDPSGVWRLNAVAPVTLGIGRYTIGALYGPGGDPVAMGTLPPVTIPQIKYIQGALAQGVALPFSQPAPTAFANPSFFGPSFHAIGVNAPEPGTFALVGVGIVGAALVRRRRTVA